MLQHKCKSPIEINQIQELDNYICYSRIANIECPHDLETSGRYGRHEALLLSGRETATIRHCRRSATEPFGGARSNEAAPERQTSAWHGNEEQTQRFSA